MENHNSDEAQLNTNNQELPQNIQEPNPEINNNIKEEKIITKFSLTKNKFINELPNICLNI